MADYGAMIMMDNGNPFVTPQSTPFCLYARLTASSTATGSNYQSASVSIPLDASYPAMVFCKTSTTAQGTSVGAARQGNIITASSSNPAGNAHTLTVYIFAIFPQNLPAWGFAIWDAAGKLILTNESRVLTDLVTVGTPGASGGINIDQTLAGSWAVAPGILGSSLWQTSQGGQPVIINVTARTACAFNGSSTRINAAGDQIGQGTAAGGTNTGIAVTAINTASYD